MSTYAENMLVTGDEDGAVHAWDVRTPERPVFALHEHHDWVSDFCFNETTHMLLSVAADGVLVATNTRKMKMVGQSYTLDDELLSMQLVKNGKSVVVGTQEGLVAIWTNGQWDDPVSRWRGPSFFLLTREIIIRAIASLVILSPLTPWWLWMRTRS